MAVQQMTRAQYEQKYGVSQAAPAPAPVKMTREQYQTTYGSPPPIPVATEEPKRGVLGKVAHFLAPTATKSFEKLGAGEKLGARDILGSALEIGSFAFPVGGIAKGLGLAGKAALTASQKVLLGITVGATGGALGEAGRAVGEGADLGKVTARSLGGGLVGGSPCLQYSFFLY